MLGPPGSSSTRRTTSTRRGGAKAENPDDVIRQLQKLPANKRCADCSSKLPSCVNLTVGSFVCITCAGIHRELSQRVKGVGHSMFTQEEADRLKTTDNDKINLVWLARYNPRTERMKPPVDNTDQHALKAWIHRKYSDKAWYAAADSPQGPAPPQQQQPIQQQNQYQQQQQQQMQPTMVHIPPKPQQQAPPVDLFATFTTPASAPGGGGGWDAFGQQQPPPPPQQQQQQQSAFQADFGQINQQAASHPPQQQQQPSGFANFNQPPPAPVDAFPADFGSSQLKQQSNSNNNAFPPSQQQQQQQQQNPPPPQGGGFANFGQPIPTAQQQQGGNGGGAFANFHQQQPGPPSQQQQGNAGGFANFGQPTPQQQQQQPQAGFGNFPQQFAPQQMQPPPQGQGGFANFGQPPNQQMLHQQQMPPQMQQQPGGFGSFGGQPQQGGLGGNLAAPPPQQQQPTATPQGMYGQSQLTSPTGNITVVNGIPPPPPPSLNTEEIPQTVSTPDGWTAADAISSISVDVPQSTPAPASAADAISSMNLDAMNLHPKNGPQNEKKPLPKGESRYQKGERVLYKSASYVGPAKVVKVHFDDALEPFYTVEVDGKEKQTDDSHLESKSDLQDEIEALLYGLSEAELVKVKQFVHNVKSSSSSMEQAKAENPAPATHINGMMGSMPTSFQLGNLNMQQQQQPSSFGGMPEPSQYSASIPVPNPSATMLGTPQSKSMPSPAGMQMQQPHQQQYLTMQQQPSQQGMHMQQTPNQMQAPPVQGVQMTQPPAAASNNSFLGIPSPTASASGPGVPPEIRSAVPAPPMAQGQQLQHPSPPYMQHQQQYPPSAPHQHPSQQQYPSQGGGFPQQQHVPPQQMQQQQHVQHQQQVPPQMHQQMQPPHVPSSPKGGNPFDFY